MVTLGMHYLTGGDAMGAEPSKGTKKDRRLKENKRKPKRVAGSRRVKRGARKGRR